MSVAHVMHGRSLQSSCRTKRSLHRLSHLFCLDTCLDTIVWILLSGYFYLDTNVFKSPGRDGNGMLPKFLNYTHFILCFLFFYKYAQAILVGKAAFKR